jgi:hypothetical protein
MMVSQKVAVRLFLSFRRKPEFRFIGQLRTYWTPASAGVTTFCKFVFIDDSVKSPDAALRCIFRQSGVLLCTPLSSRILSTLGDAQSQPFGPGPSLRALPANFLRNHHIFELFTSLSLLKIHFFIHFQWFGLIALSRLFYFKLTQFLMEG